MVTRKRIAHTSIGCPCRTRIVIFLALALLPSTAGFAIGGSARPASCKKINSCSSNKRFNLLQTRSQRRDASIVQSQYRNVLYSENGDGTNNDGGTNSQDDITSNKRSVARAGGRRTKTNKPLNLNNNNTTNNNNSLNFLRQWAAPLLILGLLLKFIFGGLFSPNPNVVYYSRSVYQSTTYSRDGNVETKRKETFQSNVPGLVEKSRDLNGNRVTIEDEIGDLEDEIMDAFNIRAW